MEQLVTSSIGSLRAVVTADWADRYRNAIAATGAAADYYTGGDTLAAALAADWIVDLVVIVDLALVTPTLARRLVPTGPRVLAFGDPADAGVAFAANLVDFLAPEPTAVELAVAIDRALAVEADVSAGDLSDRAIARLGSLGAEATRVGAALARLEALAVSTPPPPLDVERLRAMIRRRRGRERFFPGELFGEPAWDMLLDLAVAAVDGRDVAVSSLCIAAAVPATTALRWIKTLCDAGLFERREDPVDARRAFISLSPSAVTAMARYLAQTM